MLCANVTVFSDGIVEFLEEFFVELTLNTIKDNIFLENDSTIVILADLGMKQLVC